MILEQDVPSASDVVAGAAGVYDEVADEASDQLSLAQELGISAIDSLVTLAPEYREMIRKAVGLDQAALAVRKAYADATYPSQAALSADEAAYLALNKDQIAADIDKPLELALKFSGSGLTGMRDRAGARSEEEKTAIAGSTSGLGDYENAMFRASALKLLLMKDYNASIDATPSPRYPYRTAVFLIAYANRVPASSVFSSGAAAVGGLFSLAALRHHPQHLP